MRKEVNLDCKTPSNPLGLKDGYNIPYGLLHLITYNNNYYILINYCYRAITGYNTTTRTFKINK